jgi:co-chaperonin GroES (HSP10)
MDQDVSLIAKLQPRKDRIALVYLKESDDKQIGGIYLPQKARTQWRVAKVVAMGADAKGSGYDIGDLVVFQTNVQFVATMTHKVGEDTAVMIHNKDVIGRLTSGTTISRMAFEICGEWIMIRMELDNKYDQIIIPDTAQLAGMNVRYFVDQLGLVHGTELSLGQEVYVDPTRLTPIGFEGSTEKYGFVHPTFIHGWLEKDPVSPSLA